MNDPEHPPLDMRQPTDQGVRLDLTLRAQKAILALVLPALNTAIDSVVQYMYEPDKDDAEILDHLREIAAETVIDELVSLLTRDSMHISRRYTLFGVDGIPIDSLIACFAEISPDRAEDWYAQLLGVNAERYRAALKELPDRMEM